jgi:Rieske 2Fe-2S family protein
MAERSWLTHQTEAEFSPPTFQPTPTHFRSGSRTLDAEYYLSPSVFEEETERIGLTQWHCVGRASRITARGEYCLATIAGESLIVVRDREGVARAHLNVCRHRGTRICESPSGRFSETIQCPYHAWTYGLDGRLLGAPHMNEVEGFSKADHGLHQARLEEWNGFLVVNLDPNAKPLAEWLAPMGDRLRRFGLQRLVTGRRIVYEVAANWKLIFQNYSECLHCPMIHPELTCKVPYTSGANDLTEGPFLGGYMEIAEGNASVTTSGRRAARLIADLPAEDLRRGYYYTVMPNLILTIHPDYVIAYTVWPRSPTSTTIESEWLWHPDAEADPAFNPDDAVSIWDATNRQDWRITEQSQRGIGSRWYRPGPYSPREALPAAWDRAYLRMMGRDLEGGS